MNRIVIDQEYCKGCGLCIDQCPKNVYGRGRRRNTKGYQIPEIVRPQDCVGCLTCEMLCPDLAVTVEVPCNET